MNSFYTRFDKEELNSFYNRFDKEELNSFYTRFDKEELNSFYVRFDKNDFSGQQNVAMEEVRYRPSQPVQISQEAVRNCFLKAKIHSAAGPDNISGRTLEESSDSLAPVFNHLFQRSLDKGITPSLKKTCIISSFWKTSITVPVAKNPSPKQLNDYRPVELTSVPFKSEGKIIMRQLRAETAGKQDPRQFASKNRNTQNTILTLLHPLYEHFDRQKTYERVIFVDFGSASNTIQPHLMVSKLLAMSTNPTLVQWLFRFISRRTQQVRVGKTISCTRITNTGAPQGCALSPALFTLYTADCRTGAN